MDFTLFITIIAWIICPLSALKVVFCVWCQYDYDKEELLQLLDKMRGIKRSYPVGKAPIYFVVSLAWLIAYYAK